MPSFCRRLTLTVLAVLFCLALWFPFGIGTRSPDELTIKILAINDAFITPVLEAHAKSWAASTEINVSFKWIDGMDNLREAMEESLNSSNDAMDGFLFASSWLGDTHTGLSNLANSVKTEEFWGDTRSFVQASAKFSPTKVYGVPLGSQVLQLYYRQDVLEDNNIRVPKTSKDLAEAVRALAGYNFTSDPHPSFPICFSNEDLPSVFLSIFTPFIQTLGYTQGVFFTKHMTPLLNQKNPAFKQALSLWRDIVAFASNAGTEKTRNLFVNGQCAFLIDWLDVVHPLLKSPLLDNRWNVTIMPGTKSVYDPATKKLRNCKRRLCPYAGHDLINYATYSGVGSWLGGVNAGSTVKVQSAVTAFWESIASQQSGDNARKGAFYPFRLRQFANDSIWTGLAPVWFDFLKQLSLSLSGNSVLGLRILDSNQYMNVIDVNLKAFGSNQQSLMETALKIERGWDDITNSVGRQTQMELYHASLNVQMA